ncbi:hypothetical protein BD777DRAFT_13549 [Yarrowia lipolytica]|nr:hypothetical protein BD777DRAFT_13549 [Yarrowia lipolytica]
MSESESTQTSGIPDHKRTSTDGPNIIHPSYFPDRLATLAASGLICTTDTCLTWVISVIPSLHEFRRKFLTSTRRPNRDKN